MKLKPVKIGNITLKVPVIQGGMGIGVSLSSLAGAVAKEGGMGVISAGKKGFIGGDGIKIPLTPTLRPLVNI